MDPENISISGRLVKYQLTENFWLTAFKLLFIVTLTINCYNSSAQNNKYQFSHLDVNDGLSHNQVNCIYKDSKGFMWFGTMSGLNRYDGYTFKVFKHDTDDINSINDDYVVSISEGPEDKLWVVTRHGLSIYDPATEQFNNNTSAIFKSLKLPDTVISHLKKDSRGNFWFIYGSSGAYRYNPANKKTYRYTHGAGLLPSLYANYITDLNEDSKGNMWFVYNTGYLEKLDVKLNKITYRSGVLRKAVNGKIRFYSFIIDRDNDMWFYVTGVDLGVYYFDPAKNSYKYIAKETTGVSLKSNIINNIVEADDGLIWIATDHGGINVLDKPEFKITYLLNREDDTKSLRQNSVILYRDNSGIMWAGTFKEGVSYYHKNIIRFPLYRHFASDPYSLSFEDVDKFTEDGYGNLWIGTNGGGLIYFNRKTGKYTRYKHDPTNSNSLSNDIIVSLCIDHEHKLWIGTYFGGLDCFDGKIFNHYRHNDKITSSLPDDRVWSLMEDSSNRLWVGTFAGGVSVFDRDKKVFYQPFNQNQLWSSYVSSIFEDKDKNIWIGGYAGVAVLMKTSGKVIHLIQKGNEPNSLIGNNVNSITQDSRGLIWIGARVGLSIYNLKTKRFTNLLKANGLPDNLVLNILEDNSRGMWLSTANGLCHIILKPAAIGYRFQFKNFDESDGLQAREFNVNAALKTTKGELIFGGGHGFNIFDPLKIQPNVIKPQLILTDFQLFSQSVSANQEVNGHIILSKVISATNSITLYHSENVFTIEFAALNFFNPGKVKYQYTLEGFDKGWFTASNAHRKATYTNLDAGDYVFKVRACNSDGVWGTNYATLNIKIMPPYWKSALAYVIYVLTLAGILFLIRRRGIQKIRREFALEQEKKEMKLMIEREKQEVERVHEIDRLKIKFLTNVSHEFRTPLSLIMAPVDKMLNNTTDPGQKQQLNMVRKNARRLLNLVNQLLDFRKMEVNELKLNSRPGDIVKFIKEISMAFTDIADEKRIGFVFDTDVESLYTTFDHDKIERIMFNLLSNAFKFTHAGGHVSVLLNLIAERSAYQFKFMEIKVIDTGIGISKDKQELIFERFFQNSHPDSILNQGSGIGLAITKEFVTMHQGEILVESEPEHGSCFVVHLPLPIGVEGDDNIEMPADDWQLKETVPVITHIKGTSKGKKQTLLLVEDNDDFRFYLKDNLKDMYYVIEAANGKEGWQKALAQHPDIIVSDISMPEMNGKDLCHKIKNDSRTSHIPIILLTALIGEEEELKSLEIGANDYITKPFNFEILISKIKNLLKLQATFKKTYTRQLNVQVNEPVIPSGDEKFVKDIVEYISQNMLVASLSVNELSRHVGMNRNTLYKKLLMFTGKSPVEYIRFLRLKKAAHLLEHSQMNIAEVAYKVGFNTPQYFARSFKEEFDILPSEFVLQKRKHKQEKIDVS
jgi:signal transduction histidine kinase/ligand-binding sensor domain-containing protein/DNA-binding response OmpR family regulator